MPRRWLVALIALLALAGGVWALVTQGLVAVVRHDPAASEPPIGSAYLTHVRIEHHADKVGVVRHDPQLACRGLTVFGCRATPKEAYLIDMAGKLRHTWRAEVEAGKALLWMTPKGGRWMALGQGWMAPLGWDGKPAWTAPPGQYHHGLDVGPDGRIYAISSQFRPVELPGRTGRIRIHDDRIRILSREGRLRTEISMYDVFSDRIPRARLEMAARAAAGQAAEAEALERLALDSPADLLHLNTVKVVTRDDLSYARRGDLLVCLRSLDLVAVIDRHGRVRWAWDAGREVLDRPHDPEILPNGNLLVFDNGWRRGWSRVIEVSPDSGEIVWTYRADPPEAFYTKRGGSAQPLPNGNILVTEQDVGHVFEITRKGEVAWDFWNNQFGGSGGRRTIYRAWRLTPGALTGIDIAPAVAAQLRAEGYLNQATERR